MAETFSCNINWGENLDSRSYVKCFSDRKIMAISKRNNWLYFGEGGRAACTGKMCFNSIATRNKKMNLNPWSGEECFEYGFAMMMADGSTPNAIIKMH